MKITLKKKKLTNGKLSLYIKYYKGKVVDIKGETKHNRYFETALTLSFKKDIVKIEKIDEISKPTPNRLSIAHHVLSVFESISFLFARCAVNTN